MRLLALALLAQSAVAGAHVAEAPFMRRAAESGLDGFVHSTMLPLAEAEARALGLPDRGTLAPGMLADLLVVVGDPLQDIRALRDVRVVVRGGAVVVRR